jgi:hypothetical protein
LSLSDPGYLGDDKGSLKRFLGTILIILGYVMFMGSLVAIMAQWLNSSLKKLEAGLSPISMKGHILILGWNNRTSIIIRELLLSESRVFNFLKSIRKSKVRIVILTPEVNQAIEQHMKIELGNLWNKKMIYFRSGNHLRIEDLQRVDYLNAGVIIIPGISSIAIKDKSQDSNAAKTIMTISANDREGKHPPIVAEIFDEDKASLIAAGYRGPVDIITSPLLISRIISQNIRHKNLSMVYTEILCNDKNEIYLKSPEKFIGMRFNDIRFAYEHAIPLGLFKTHNDSETVILCPEDDVTIESSDLVILLAEDADKTDTLVKSPHIHNSLHDHQISEICIRKKILITGWSRKVPFILRELNSYDKDQYEIDIFSRTPVSEREALMNAIIFQLKE